MVWLDPSFVVATIPEEEKYEGTEIDENVRKALPEGATIKWVSTFGASFWAISTRIDTILSDGREQSYFLKMYTAEEAKEIAKGEFVGSSELHTMIPEFVPTPIACGVSANNPSRGFYLAELRDMTDELPGVSEFVSVVHQIHQKPSPNGKFGYPMTTFRGTYPVNNEWCNTWEEWFTRDMRDTLKAELAIQGGHAELEELGEKILTKVIPRLIRPMETEGRSIKPVLLHGDLWHGNVSCDNETNDPVLYDPCCVYGHNEYEFAMWRSARYRLNRPHVRAYFKLAEMSEPAEDQDDRHELYAVRNDLSTSICWPANLKLRQMQVTIFP